MNEVTLWKGQLVDLRHRYNEMDLEASAIVTNIRMMLNPHEDDLTKLPVGQIENSADRLRELVEQMRKMKEQMARLEESIRG